MSPRKKIITPITPEAGEDLKKSAPLKPRRSAPKKKKVEEISIPVAASAAPSTFISETPVIETPPNFMMQESQNVNFNPSPKFYRRIALTFLGTAIVLVLAVIYFTSGSAEINLSLKNKDVKVDTTAALVSKPTDKTQLAGVVTQLVVKDEKTYPVSGGGNPVVGVAMGKVTLFNTKTTPQTLVATTRLLSPTNVLFRLKNTVTIPANGQIEADVYADKAGAEGEIEASKFSIPGLSVDMQKLVFAESKAKMLGGLKYNKVLTEEDVKTAEDTLIATLFENGQAQLKAASSTASYNASLFNYSISQIKTDPKVGSLTDQFKITLVLKVNGIFYNQVDVNKYLSEKMRTSLADYETLSGVPSRPTVELNHLDFEKQTAELHLTQTAAAQVSYLEDVIDKNKILGKSVADVEIYLQSLPWIEKADIKISPSWSKTIPSEMSKVKIKINN